MSVFEEGRIFQAKTECSVKPDMAQPNEREGEQGCPVQGE
jgi:hypothetical protein